MKTTLIMLPQPILVSDEPLRIGQLCYGEDINNANQTTIHQVGSHDVANKYPKVIAGIEGFPKLDLSLIAEKIGWVDVEKLAYNHLVSIKDNTLNTSWEHYTKQIFIEGFKTNQSLNEKKYSEEEALTLFKKGIEWGDMNCETGGAYGEGYPYLKCFNESVLRLSKPKEYNVGYIQEGNTIKITKIIN